MSSTRIAREYEALQRLRCAAALISLALLCNVPAAAQETIDAGVTGFDVKRPVLAAACPNGCPWGELGDFVQEAMQPFGYEVILCRNCNRDLGPPLVSMAGLPPELSAADTFTGTTTRVNAPVDFGVTSSSLLAWGYAGKYNYMRNGPFTNLRLIARIEDPTYLLLAVKADSNITDLSQVADQHMKVTILGGGSPISQPVLDYYGLTRDAVMSWGGSFSDAIVAGATGNDVPFDILINEIASPANNPESAIWSQMSQRYKLRFLDLPAQVLDQLTSDKSLGVERVTVKWGFLRGIDRSIETVARTGEAVFGRDDMPEQAAYDAAKAIDQHRSALKWYIRPYSYDSRTVWNNFGVPLHPGAEQYYKEMGYMPGGTGEQGCAPAADGDSSNIGGKANASRSAAEESDGGCSVKVAAAGSDGLAALVATAVLLCWCTRRRRA
jgi:uncharacterized protein